MKSVKYEFAEKILQGGGSRIVWVDVLKGIFLLFICFSHCGYVLPALRVIVMQTGSYWVPIFFILSGYLFVMKKNDTTKSYIKKKSRSLLLPYLFFCILFILLDPNTYIVAGCFERNLNRMLFCGSGVEKASPLWFVFSLYISSVFAFFILHIIKIFSMLITVALATFVLYQPPLDPNGACMWIIALSAVAFIVSGYYLKCFLVYFNTWNVFFKLVTVSVCCVVGTYGIWGDNIGDFHLNVINNYPPPIVCLACFSCILFNGCVY